MNSKTIEELVDGNPQEAIRHLSRIEMYYEALKSAVHEWGRKNGDFVSNNKDVKLQKRTRSTTKLDSEKAAEILESSGFDLMDIADIRITEEAIKAKLGEVDGNKVIAELISAGAIKTFKTEYWRIQCK